MSAVLVVDDSQVTHALVEKVLVRAGYETAHTASPTEALQLVKDNKFDAVIADIVMPGIDGIQLAQLIRSTAGEHRDVPIVFYSAFIDAPAIQRAETVQPAYLVAKDGDIKQLVTTVESAIETAG